MIAAAAPTLAQAASRRGPTRCSSQRILQFTVPGRDHNRSAQQRQRLLPR